MITHRMQRFLDLLDGVVCGDGHLSPVIHKTDYSQLILGVSPKQLGFAEEFSEWMRIFGFPAIVRAYQNQVRVVVGSGLFGVQRRRWYPDGIKRLPNDLSNSPTMWRWLYAGDGSIRQCSSFGSDISIHVESFTLQEIERLAAMLSLHDVRAWPTKSKVSSVTGNRLYSLQISVKDTNTFLNMIGPPVRSLEYKWTRVVVDDRNCLYCGKDFLPTRSDMVYCCYRCGVKASHPAYSTDPVVIEQHRRYRRESERAKRENKPGFKPRPSRRI